MRETPKELQIYRHFKGALYQIVAIAIHTETTDKLVIYRSLSNPERVFARPLEMFLSEVNHKKYPDVKAKYRFTLLEEVEEPEKDSIIDKAETVKDSIIDKAESVKETIVGKIETIKGNILENTVKADETENFEKEKKVYEECLETESDDNRKYRDDGTLVLDPIVEKILDSKEYTDKIEAFELLRGKCTEDMLATLAMSLDIQLSGETIEEKYADVLRCLRMHQKYETNRLR